MPPALAGPAPRLQPAAGAGFGWRRRLGAAGGAGLGCLGGLTVTCATSARALSWRWHGDRDALLAVLERQDLVHLRQRVLGRSQALRGGAADEA